MLRECEEGTVAVPSEMSLDPNSEFCNEHMEGDTTDEKEESDDEAITCTPAASMLPPDPTRKGVSKHLSSLPEMGDSCSYIRQNLHFEQPNFAANYADRFSKVHSESHYSNMQSAPKGTTTSELLQNAYR